MAGSSNPVLGIIGAGRVGTAIARLALRAGYEVRLARAGSVQELALMVGFVAPGATPLPAAEAPVGADLVVLAVPLARYRELPAARLAGAVVVDAMNYWPSVDGRLDAFEGPLSSSEVVQRALPGARVVKALNHVGYRDLESGSRLPGAPDRQGIALAGDDRGARAAVARLVEDLGYDAHDLGALVAGRLLEPGGPVFGRPLDVTAREALAASAGRPPGPRRSPA